MFISKTDSLLADRASLLLTALMQCLGQLRMMTLGHLKHCLSGDHATPDAGLVSVGKHFHRLPFSLDQPPSERFLRPQLQEFLN